MSEKADKLLELMVGLEKYAEADKQGRLLVLPCRVGDTVYCITDYRRKFHSRIVKGCVGSIRLSSKRKIVDIHGYYCDKEDEFYSGRFAFDSFGKSVFFKKEDAEKSLREDR